jgi:general secretion pathway protein L
MMEALKQTSLADWASRSAQWWLREAQSLLPAGFTARLLDDGARQLVVTPDEGRILIVLRDGNRRILMRSEVARGADLNAAIDQMLRQARLRRSEVAFGLALSDATFFAREIRLPREAGRSLDSIAFMDLLRNTPFRADDIRFDFAAEQAWPHIHLKQFVIRRDLLDEAAAALGLPLATLDFVESSDVECNRLPIAIRLRKTEPRGRRTLALAGLLLATCCLAAAYAASLVSQRQTNQLESLEADLAKARTDAHRARSAAETTDKQQSAIRDLRLRKQEGIGLLELWEELSRILPDTAWVQELRLARAPNGGDFRVIVSGLSFAAANLVETLDRSPILSEVALTAPISLDPIEKRERFVLEAKVARETVRSEP